MAVAAAVGSGACHRAERATPVATVSVTPARTRVPIGAPFDLTYTFQPTDAAAIKGDYMVFVHALAADGTVLWNDDHAPAVPTSQWKAGQPVTYTRTTFVPSLPHPGDVTIEVGVYRDGDRLALQSSDTVERDLAAREYRVATLQIAPASESTFLIYSSGWYPDEYAPSDPTSSWRWTQKTAVLAFKNPHADATLFLEVAARTELFTGHPQQVSVSANDVPLATFAADSAVPVLKRIPIPAAALGSGDMAQVRIDVDQTFAPASLPGGGSDPRTLGIRVYHVYVDGR